MSVSTAFRIIRKARGLSQEAFSDVSSRTYLSAIERNLKSPTINKINALCEVLNIHPLTLLTLSYAEQNTTSLDSLLDIVRTEIESLGINHQQ